MPTLTATTSHVQEKDEQRLPVPVARRYQWTGNFRSEVGARFENEQGNREPGSFVTEGDLKYILGKGTTYWDDLVEGGAIVGKGEDIAEVIVEVGEADETGETLEVQEEASRTPKPRERAKLVSTSGKAKNSPNLSGIPQR